MVKNANDNKSSIFKKAMLIYAGVLAFLVVVGLVVLWSFLSSYQKSLPETAAERFLATSTEEYWLTFLNENVYGSPYSDKEADVKAAYDTYIKGKSLSARRSSKDSKDGLQVFKIRNGEMELCSVAFSENGSGAFGMARWAESKTTASAAFLDAVNKPVTLLVPPEAEFTVNGVSAKTEGEAVKSPFSTVFETGGGFMKYCFRIPCASGEVTVTYNGSTLKATENDNGTYIYDLPGDRIEKSLVVPEGAEVYVNGVRLTTEFISEKGVAYPFLNALEKELADAPKSTVYTVKGLYKEPELRVVYGGDELEGVSDGDKKVKYAFATTGVDYTLQVPAGAVVTVNGIEVSGNSEYIAETDVIYTKVGDYVAELISPVKCNLYCFKGMMFKPDIKVTDKASGKELSLLSLDSSSFTCNAKPEEDKISVYTELANDFTVAMMEYMFYGREKLVETFPRALSYTRHNSKAYISIRDSYSGIYWRRQHEIVYNSLYIDNFVTYADNCFMCDVHYDVTGNAVTINRVDYAKGVYRLLYVQKNGKWEVVEFELLSE